jgi:hypothetical protein
MTRRYLMALLASMLAYLGAASGRTADGTTVFLATPDQPT